jgi:hypothetical protein
MIGYLDKEIISRKLLSSFHSLQQWRSNQPPHTVMDRFQEMQVFVRIAERQSFTRAADDLQIPRATVTNLMKRMEQRLGARLLERTTRTVRLTHDGEAYYRRCVRLLADMEEAEGSFRDAAPKGLLRSRAIRVSSCISAKTTGWSSWCARVSIACCARGICRIHRWSGGASRGSNR